MEGPAIHSPVIQNEVHDPCTRNHSIPDFPRVVLLLRLLAPRAQIPPHFRYRISVCPSILRYSHIELWLAHTPARRIQTLHQFTPRYHFTRRRGWGSTRHPGAVRMPCLYAAASVQHPGQWGGSTRMSNSRDTFRATTTEYPKHGAQLCVSPSPFPKG